jgi:hypothetical protein
VSRGNLERSDKYILITLPFQSAQGSARIYSLFQANSTPHRRFLLPCPGEVTRESTVIRTGAAARTCETGTIDPLDIIIIIIAPGQFWLPILFWKAQFWRARFLGKFNLDCVPDELLHCVDSSNRILALAIRDCALLHLIPAPRRLHLISSSSHGPLKPPWTGISPLA